MRNIRSATLTAAIATVLSSKFSGGAEVIPREPEPDPYPRPVTVWGHSRPDNRHYYSVMDRKKKAVRKKNKVAAASRKRNRK